MAGPPLIIEQVHPDRGGGYPGGGGALTPCDITHCVAIVHSLKADLHLLGIQLVLLFIEGLSGRLQPGSQLGRVENRYLKWRALIEKRIPRPPEHELAGNNPGRNQQEEAEDNKVSSTHLVSFEL